MEIITQKTQNSKRYLPHEISTKIHAVETYRQTGDVSYICRKYHVSKASLMRWNKQYDGTRESLAPKSHKPHSAHPNSRTEQEIKWIKDYHRRNPNITICELYGKLREDKAYTRHPGSLYRVFIRLGFRKKVESTKKKSRHLGKYDTPTEIGKKWQLDVKYVPTACYSGNDDERFYQYTVIEEASRKRFIYPYKEHGRFLRILTLRLFHSTILIWCRNCEKTNEECKIMRRLMLFQEWFIVQIAVKNYICAVQEVCLMSRSI